jgi:hypothetical protein
MPLLGSAVQVMSPTVIRELAGSTGAVVGESGSKVVLATLTALIEIPQ